MDAAETGEPARRLLLPRRPRRAGTRSRDVAQSSCSHFEMAPPIMPPTIGATQKSQRSLSASAPPKIAVAVERAGLSEAFETGIATRWNSVSASPIAIGAKPAGA